MGVIPLASLLSQNSYPGRGIVLGRCQDGRALVAYFIMGRSENSRNRVFVEREGDLMIQAADPAKVEDASLTFYTPVRKFGPCTIVANGDQCDTVYTAVQEGGSFGRALQTRTFEPDAPHYTPRITGLLERGVDGFRYTLSLIKTAGGHPDSVQRFFYEYPQPLPGEGHFIHTYQGDGSPLPSFVGEPVAVALEGDADTIGREIWAHLNRENKVALFVRTIAQDGQEQTVVCNRYTRI